MNRPRISDLVRQISELHSQEHQIILVSSGAVFAGREVLGPPPRGKDIPFKQVLAATGQVRLMALYQELFSTHDIQVAQALLTRVDLANREHYLNARNTLSSLLQLGVIPIVNENDVVAIEEIKIGDNDNLSALVANLVDADWLIIVTDQAGLFTADPRRDPQARLISGVTVIDEEVRRLAGKGKSIAGTGGMVTKIEAAELATRSGTTVFIASGKEPEILLRLVAGEALGTRFSPKADRLESRKRWILAEPVRGEIEIDEGAVKAVIQQGKSLLPAGVRHVKGDFERGQTVGLTGPDGREIARGIINYNAVDLRAIQGRRSTEIVGILGYDYGPTILHRDNLVLIGQAAKGEPE